MRRLFIALLFALNLAAVVLYLYERYPGLQEAADRVSPVADALERGVGALSTRGLVPAHAVAGAAALVGLVGLVSWIRLRKRRPSRGSSRLGKAVTIGSFVVLGGFYGWIVRSEEEVVRFGPIAVQRGPRDAFLAFSLHVFLLVLSAHVLALLGFAFHLAGRKKPAPRKRPAEA